MPDAPDLPAGRPPTGRVTGDPDPNLPRLRDAARAAGLYPLPSPPPCVDRTAGVTWFGSMGNTQLNNCTCAAYYHARQIWALNSGRASADSILTMDGPVEADHDAIRLYRIVGNYDPHAAPPGHPNPTDRGAYEQKVLRFLCESGAPVGGDSAQRDWLLRHYQLDARNLEDLRYAIWQCGVAYVATHCPSSWRETNYAHLDTWDVADPAQDPPQESSGHALVLVAYGDYGFKAISWGRLYTLTPAFVQTYVAEAHAIIDRGWLDTSGHTPVGLTLEQLEADMGRR